ncbi:MAG: hypothetical protein ACE5GN_04300 [Waddliaceae bacterium]
MNRHPIIFLFAILFAYVDALGAGMSKPERTQAQLIGPVKQVKIEFAKVRNINGKWVPELPRIPWIETTYAKNGYRIEEEQFYTEKTLDFKSVFNYDTEGNLSDGIEYDYKGGVSFKWTYAYDPVKKHIEKKQLFPDGALFSKTTYLYDDLGNLIEEKRYLQQTKNRFRWHYLYDNEGRKTEEAYYLMRSGNRNEKMKSLLNFKAVFAYDNEGNLITETKYNASGMVSSKRHFEYKYDHLGNWVTQTALESIADDAKPEPTEITYRTIHYYPQ